MPKPTNHDEYIAAAAEFAGPILEKVRAHVHKACPDVEESMKWSHPHFGYKGMLVGMSAHKAHVNVTFWHGAELEDPDGLLEVVGKTKMGNLRAEKVSDLPNQRTFVKFVKEAMRLNEAAESAPSKPQRKTGKKAGKKATTAARSVDAPDDLLIALRKKKRALATYDAFSYTNKKEYVEWVTEAKREATREKRVAQAVEWMSEGKPRNWKYMKEWS